MGLNVLLWCSHHSNYCCSLWNKSNLLKKQKVTVAWKATLRLRNKANKTIRPDDDSRAQLEYAHIKLAVTIGDVI